MYHDAVTIKKKKQILYFFASIIDNEIQFLSHFSLKQLANKSFISVIKSVISNYSRQVANTCIRCCYI